MSRIKQTAVQSAVNQALGLLEGHEDFVKRSTGLTVDPHQDHYLQNTDYVLSNNRHFIADTMAEYQPNGDATTEGQALHTIGYCHAYIATGNPVYLDKAKKAWQAYINYFYDGQPVPEKASRYVCNWLVNGKEPTLADYPVNPVEPTQGGFKCVPLVFTNGAAQIPHGAPYWGEYLDMATFAHRGHMTWDSINASIQQIEEANDGTIDWQLVYDKYRILSSPIFEDAFLDTFTDNNPQSWTGNLATNVVPTVSGGWIKPPRVDDTSIIGIMKSGLSFSGSEFNTLRFRIKKTGEPVWKGTLWYKTDSDSDWNPSHKLVIDSPTFNANGVSEQAVPVEWATGKITAIRLEVQEPVDEESFKKNFFEIDYIGTSKRVGEEIKEPWVSTAWIDWEAYLGREYKVIWGDSGRGKTYPISWLNVWTNNKIGIGKGPNDQLWAGEIIETEIPQSDLGKVQLEDTSINGVWLLNYTSKVPVAFGGYQFKRNQPWHNRPVHTPFLGSVNQLGNAADAEVWFIDACYLLYRITGEIKYRKALESVFFTANEYTEIDSTDKFFRQSLAAKTPFTDAISYGFSYPASTTVDYSRDEVGYIVAKTDQACQTYFEQQAVVFRVNERSKMRVTFGGRTETGGEVGMSARLTIASTKSDADSDKHYKIALPKTTSLEPKVYDIPLGQLAKEVNDETGQDYLVADYRAVTEYGDCTWGESYEESVYDGRTATVIKAQVPTPSDGFIVGFWLTDSKKVDFKKMVFRTNANFIIRITDDSSWNWFYVLGNTDNKWVSKDFETLNLTLADYQPSHGDDEQRPSKPFYSGVSQMNVIPLDDVNSVTPEFSYYCINDIPPLFKGEDGWTVLFRAILSGGEAYTAKLGDCTIVDYRTDSLAYCPGVIPFSNIYAEGTNQVGAWHGMPYPGYQYPFMYTIHSTDKYAEQLYNQIHFLYDSQKAYTEDVGVVGPAYAAYVWNRWDNYKYGTADTWTPYHWGDGKPWSGYQCRAYNAAARSWYELVVRGQPVPSMLKTYVENWAKWLVDFAREFGGHTPNNFPIAPEKPVWEDNDFTAHMCGLWLAGTCYAALAGSEVEGLDYLMDCCVGELAEGLTIVADPSKNINGAWSPAAREESDNGMSFGFYTGECFRGLSLYIMYKQYGKGYDFYQHMAIPDHYTATINI